MTSSRDDLDPLVLHENVINWHHERAREREGEGNVFAAERHRRIAMRLERELAEARRLIEQTTSGEQTMRCYETCPRLPML
jgi:hypothetical protein